MIFLNPKQSKALQIDYHHQQYRIYQRIDDYSNRS